MEKRIKEKSDKYKEDIEKRKAEHDQFKKEIAPKINKYLK